MKLFKYESYKGLDESDPNSDTVGALFLGTEKKQIINTARYYKETRGIGFIDIPSLEDISEIKSVIIDVGFSLSTGKFVEAKIRDNVIFNVNLDAVPDVQEVAGEIEKFKRADLYKFIRGDSPKLCFLPGYIMKGIESYDWAKHRKEADRIIRQKQKDIEGLVRDGSVSIR